jgi:hypothetical protein
MAPSLGDLERSHQEAWGTVDYTDVTKPVVFMGLYGLPDFYTLWRHRGPKAVLWCGSDITHFKNGYWLDKEGSIRMSSRPLATWLNKNCDNYVENVVEQKALQALGVGSSVVPSFFGKVDMPITYTWSSKPKVYASVSGDNFELYGWDKINNIAHENPGIEFHLYGNSTDWYTEEKNIIVHGRVPKEQMNEETASMQGGLRPTEFDGASEIIVKALLRGQYCFSFISYPFVHTLDDLNLLASLKTANIEGRDWWRTHLNLYPWNSNILKKRGEE